MRTHSLLDIFQKHSNILQPPRNVCILFHQLVVLVSIEVDKPETTLLGVAGVVGQKQRRTNEFYSSELFKNVSQFFKLLQEGLQKAAVDPLPVKEEQRKIVFDLFEDNLLSKVLTHKTLLELLPIVQLHYHSVDPKAVTVSRRFLELSIRFFVFFYAQLQVQNVGILEVKGQVSQTNVLLLRPNSLVSRCDVVYPQVAMSLPSLNCLLFLHILHLLQLQLCRHPQIFRQKHLQPSSLIVLLNIPHELIKVVLRLGEELKNMAVNVVDIFGSLP